MWVLYKFRLAHSDECACRASQCGGSREYIMNHTYNSQWANDHIYASPKVIRTLWIAHLKNMFVLQESNWRFQDNISHIINPRHTQENVKPNYKCDIFTGRRSKLLIGVAWGLSALLSVPMLVIFQIKMERGMQQCWATLLVDQWQWQVSDNTSSGEKKSRRRRLRKHYSFPHMMVGPNLW